MTDEAQYDSSIVFQGGQATGAFAAGTGASAVFHGTPSGNAVEEQLNQLRQIVEQHRTSLEDVERGLRDLADLIAAMRVKPADRGRILGALQRIATAGGSLVAIGEVAEKTKDVVARLLS